MDTELLNFLFVIPFNALHALKNQLFVCLFVCFKVAINLEIRGVIMDVNNV